MGTAKVSVMEAMARTRMVISDVNRGIMLDMSTKLMLCEVKK